MATDAELIAELWKTYAEEQSIAAFEEWFLETSWDTETLLARAVGGVLAETSGISDDRVVRELLGRILGHAIVVVPFSDAVVSSGKATTVGASVSSTRWERLVVEGGILRGESPNVNFRRPPVGIGS